jgi:hypothetical protein
MKSGCVALLAAAVVCGSALGYSPEMRKAMLGGPWELQISRSADASAVKFEVKVADEDKVAEIGTLVPVMGSPYKVRIEKYLPDLQWDSHGAEVEDGGVVVRLNVKGPNMETDIWLDSADVKKSAISAQVGGIQAVGISEPKQLEEMAKGLTDSKGVGLVSVWLEEGKKPLQYVVEKGKKAEIAGTPYTLEFADYLCHYSIDMETKKVTNASERPVNPAVLIRLSGGGKEYEKWLWSRFPASPHETNEMPFRAQFVGADFGGEGGKYVLLGAKGAEAWMIRSADKKKKAEKIKVGERYPFADEAYSVSVEEYFGSAELINEWKNGSETLKNPAIIVSVEKSGKKSEYALELNKPINHTEGTEAVSLVFGKKGGGMPAGMGGMQK